MHTIELILEHSMEFVLIIILLFITKRYILGLIISIVLLYFHRIPSTCNFYNGLTDIDNIILSPAYGTIRQIVNNNDEIVVSIFLNVDDIHTQYVPLKGKIIDSSNYEGGYKHANSVESNGNSKMITDIMTDYGIMRIVQISGMLARKIIVFPKIGESVKGGDLLGFIRFGY